jgi:ribosomal protein S18 acetylase RimI-like enzyme
LVPDSLNDLVFRAVETFPEPAFSALAREAFSDYEPSPLLTEVLNAEAATKPGHAGAANDGALRIGAFRGDSLVAWTYARREGAHLHMINSGVAPSQRRLGVYSKLVQLVIEHAGSHGHIAIQSRHSANNNAVIVAKLKLGFFVSGFEYSEVYGPLVRLTFLPGELRRALYQSRATPIRRVDPQ